MDWKVEVEAPTQFHNTPATWPIYVCGLNIAHLKEKGLKYYQEMAAQKSNTIYDFIDNSGFYSNNIEKPSRSHTNIIFRVNNDETLEAKFIKQAEEKGLVSIKGHRSLGGCRVSIYNAMPYEGVLAMIDHMI